MTVRRLSMITLIIPLCAHVRFAPGAAHPPGAVANDMQQSPGGTSATATANAVEPPREEQARASERASERARAREGQRQRKKERLKKSMKMAAVVHEAARRARVCMCLNVNELNGKN